MKKFVIGLVIFKLVFLTLFLTLLFSSCRKTKLSPVAPAPTVAPVDANINRPTSNPYTGDLSIFESEDRAKNLQIDRVMDILKITDGKTVADIGAGSGWFTVRAAKRVGNSGKVFAVEINQEYVNYINDRAEKEGFENIQTILGTEDDPKLPADAVDAVLILKTYHEIGQPIKVLENLRKSLKKDALIGIIDKDGNGDDHGIKQEVVIEELKRAGFVSVDNYDFVKPEGMDYFLVFRAAN